MQASEAAQIFHDWAHVNALLADGPQSPVVSPEAAFLQIAPLTDQGIAVLRARQIQAIAFDESSAAIVVFTKRTIPASRRVRTTLPNAVDNVEIRYRQGVQSPVGGLPSLPHGGPVYRIRHAAGGDRYVCGSSISVGNVRDAGTFGCLVRDAAGVLHGLSNNHVSGSCSFAPVGLPILAPGVYDVAATNLAPFTLGVHTRALAMVPGSTDNVDPAGNLDAAIFRIQNEGLVSSFQGDQYDTPSATGTLVGGLQVEKVGRTTGHTRGTLTGQMHGAVSIPYNAPLYGFTGPVSFAPMFAIIGSGDLFSDSGDSGSLITAIRPDGQRIAVGIVVGGMIDASAPGGKLTLALPIESTLQALGVTLVSSHNV